MIIENMELVGKWTMVKQVAMNTIGKLKDIEKEPSDRWKKIILQAEHSPIRKLHYGWTWVGLPSWVSVHFTRHKIGIEHFVSTQRTDRTGVDRDSLRQDELVNHTVEASAQALMTISRKRLCSQAASETRLAWLSTKRAITTLDPVMGSMMVPECVYRGFCPEFKSCGFDSTDKYKQDVLDYRKRE